MPVGFSVGFTVMLCADRTVTQMANHFFLALWKWEQIMIGHIHSNQRLKCFHPAFISDESGVVGEHGMIQHDFIYWFLMGNQTQGFRRVCVQKLNIGSDCLILKQVFRCEGISRIARPRIEPCQLAIKQFVRVDRGKYRNHSATSTMVICSFSMETISV